VAGRPRLFRVFVSSFADMTGKQSVLQTVLRRAGHLIWCDRR
jgi:hypothetical protein